MQFSLHQPHVLVQELLTLYFGVTMKRWPLRDTYPWDTAPLLRVLPPFVAGIIVYDVSFPCRITACLIAASAAFIALISLSVAPRLSRLRNVLLWPLLAGFVFCAAISVSYFSDVRNNPTWFGRSLHTGSSYCACITDAPTLKERSWKLPVTLISCIKQGSATPVSGNAFLYLYRDLLPMTLKKGDTILIPGNWQPIKNAGNPFEFDYAAYCRRNNILFQQSLSVSNIHLLASGNPQHFSFIDRAHDWCMSQLGKYIPEPKAKGLIQAMLLGDEVNLDEDLRQSYAQTGIIHVIAISGGNVAIFFIFISFVLWWLKDKRHWIKYAIALPLVWFYVIMAGAQPSAIRAAIMFSLLAFGIMMQKSNNSLSQLIATAFVLLCAQPMWLFSLGFQLSFVAVLSLILFYAPIYRWLSPPNKVTRALWSTVAASLAAEILVAPLVIYYFHTFPAMFIVANVLAYLFMGLVLLLAIAIIAVSFIPPVASLLGIITTALVTFFDSIVSVLQKLIPPSFRFLVLTNWELLSLYAVISAIAIFLLKKKKTALYGALAMSCLLVSLLCRDEWISLHQQQLIVFNTGKTNHTELITGKTFTVLHTDTSQTKRTGYATAPAHTWWHAWQSSAVSGENPAFTLGKSLLVLDSSITSSASFPIDYLVVNISNPDAAELNRIFAPRTIIIGNGLSKKRKEKFISTCKKLGIALYDLSEKGAFILE